jgi:hypothetical protein
MHLASIKTKNEESRLKSRDLIKYATKADIKLLRIEIEKLEMRVIIKVGAMMAFWASAILTIIKL